MGEGEEESIDRTCKDMVIIGKISKVKIIKTEGRELTRPLHTVQIGWYIFLLTEQAETYLEICVLIYHSTYICPSLFGWKENLIFKETVIFKL